jgi:hypothetical protein
MYLLRLRERGVMGVDSLAGDPIARPGRLVYPVESESLTEDDR